MYRSVDLHHQALYDTYCLKCLLYKHESLSLDLAPSEDLGIALSISNFSAQWRPRVSGSKDDSHSLDEWPVCLAETVSSSLSEESLCIKNI